jgi:hypothetical protein
LLALCRLTVREDWTFIGCNAEIGSPERRAIESGQLLPAILGEEQMRDVNSSLIGATLERG